MLFLPLVSLFLQFRGLNAQSTVDENGISLDQKVLNTERMILTPQELGSVVSNCTLFAFANPNQGEESSAEWIRIVFHDFITYNATTGKGGLDASVSFESDRAENAGGAIFINDTIRFFSQFYSVYSPMADLIALGMADVLLECNPNNVNGFPFRVGRVDAPGPGPSGVPGPTDSLAVATAAFKNAGFSQTQMIQAVACGHTFGAVHESNFPGIVPDSFNTSTEFDGPADFDTTPGNFDPLNVQQYLSGTGNGGGILVVGHNVSARSDLRIFSSDNNATVKTMTTASSFQSICYNIFEAMLNTVPSGVVLSDPVLPRTWITRESHLDLLSSGGVTYSGNITTHSWAGNPPAQATYQYNTVGGGNTGPKFSNPNAFTQPSPAFGTITDYTFSDTLNSPSITSISIESVFTEPINLNLFIIPSLTFSNAAGNQFILRAALLTSLSPTGTTLTATLFYGTPQPNTQSPRLQKDTYTLTSFKTIGSYTIFQAVVTPTLSVVLNPTFRVALGTTQTSATVDFFGVGGPGTIFGVCTTTPMTSC